MGKKKSSLSKRELENLIRLELLEKLKKFLEEEYGEVYVVPSSKSGTNETYALACPCLDAERNESVVRVEVNIPRGSRTSSGYDVYTVSEEFQQELANRSATDEDEDE